MSEEILGSLVVEKIRLLKVNITYILLLTSDRLVAAKFGSVKEALLITAGIAVGCNQVGLVEAQGQRKEIPGLAEIGEKLTLTPQAILAADEDNFELPYYHITGIEARKGGASVAHWVRTGRMVISTHKKKLAFEITYGQRYEDCVNVIRAVLPKILTDQSKRYVKYCPICREEFQDWVKVCPDCGVNLVDELPALPVQKTGTDPLVRIASAPNEAVANMWSGILEEHGIYCLVKGGQLGAVYGMAASVNREVHVLALEAERAREILAPFLDS